MIMIENASLLVYLWSIYENIETMIGLVFAISGICIVFLLVFRMMNIFESDEYMSDALKKIPSKTIITVFSVASILTVSMPSKEYLPYIIMKSYKDEKIHKVDKIIDKSLDKALEELQGNK